MLDSRCELGTCEARSYGSLTERVSLKTRRSRTPDIEAVVVSPAEFSGSDLKGLPVPRPVEQLPIYRGLRALDLP